MDIETLSNLLNEVRSGQLSVKEAVERLKILPFERVDEILFDHHRQLRKGFPEVIYGPGKSRGQLVKIIERLIQRKVPLLVTRLSDDTGAFLCSRIQELNFHPAARAAYFPKTDSKEPEAEGGVLIIAAGTSDLPVVEEAALTLELMDIPHRKLIDVGIAGVHRLFAHLNLLASADVVIAIAGMEGALPSLIAGMVECPVVAVPTSTGYGSNFNGLAALLTMLNSCAPGIGVVNIDNGFGAAALSALIVK